ncbi:MAG: hypothetical protein HY709_06455, partial [Candidatus Latescibacteria bacterium]|nr:hypothetical protein [Candidatus Latescibacterota bacterium]
MVEQSMILQTQRQGTFRCSDEVLTRIWRIGQESFDRSTVSSFRQKQGQKQNWKEMRVTAMVRECLTSDQTLRVKYLCEMVPEGAFSDDHLHWLMAVSDYYRFTGDVRLTRELFPTVKRVLRRLNVQEDMEGLLQSDEQEAAA